MNKQQQHPPDRWFQSIAALSAFGLLLCAGSIYYESEPMTTLSTSTVDRDVQLMRSSLRSTSEFAIPSAIS
jgi:hypothetical protein